MSEITPAPDSIYLAAYGSSVIEEETLRAIGISLLGVDSDARAAATYRPNDVAGRSPELAWSIWLEGTFCTRLGGNFCAAYAAAFALKMDEVFVIDAAIDRALSLEERTGSLEAAEAFLDGKHQAEQLPQWKKLEDAIDSGATPGHLTTVFATQCAVFGLPLMPALVAYTFYEWHLGECSIGGNATDLRLRHFQDRHPATFLAVRRVFGEAQSGEDSPLQLASV